MDIGKIVKKTSKIVKKLTSQMNQQHKWAIMVRSSVLNDVIIITNSINWYDALIDNYKSISVYHINEIEELIKNDISEALNAVHLAKKQTRGQIMCKEGHRLDLGHSGKPEEKINIYLNGKKGGNNNDETKNAD